MAVLRFDYSPRTMDTHRAKNAPQSAVSYMVRERKYGPTAEIAYLDRTGKEVHEREDLVWKQLGNMPAWAREDPYVFFDKAYTYEARGRWAVAMEMALPRELTPDQQKALAEDFVRAHLSKQPYLMVQHQPMASDGLEQPHIHILFSERAQDGDDRTPETYFKRWNRAEPERGGTQKDRFFTARQCPTRLRQAWADLTNAALEREGHEVRVDPRSVADRGIERGVARRMWHDQAMEKGAFPSQQPDAREERQRTAAEEQRLAREYWEQRKQELGIGNDISRDTMVAVTGQWARNYTPGKWQKARTLDERRHDLEAAREVAQDIEQVSARLTLEMRKAQRNDEEGRPTSFRDAEKQEAVVREADRIIDQWERRHEQALEVVLEAQRDERPAKGIRVRLHEKDRGPRG